MELKETVEWELRYWNDPILSQICDPVRGTEFGNALTAYGRSLAQFMRDKNGIGIAAPQVGVAIRLFAMLPHYEGFGGKMLPTDEPLVVCNPVLEFKGSNFMGEEGCLSLPSIYSQVSRAETVLMKYTDTMGQEQELELHGINARIVAHEVDHLDGVMFLSRLTRQLRRSAERDWEKAKKKYVK